MEFCEYLKEGARLILVPEKDSSSIYQADPMAFPKKPLLLGQLRDLGQQSSTVIPGSLPLTCSEVPYSSRERKGWASIVERAKSIFGLQIPSYLLAHILNSFSSSVANGEEGGLDGEREQSSHLSQAQRGHREAGTGST